MSENNNSHLQWIFSLVNLNYTWEQGLAMYDPRAKSCLPKPALRSSLFIADLKCNFRVLFVTKLGHTSFRANTVVFYTLVRRLIQRNNYKLIYKICFVVVFKASFQNEKVLKDLWSVTNRLYSLFTYPRRRWLKKLSARGSGLLFCSRHGLKVNQILSQHYQKARPFYKRRKLFLTIKLSIFQGGWNRDLILVFFLFLHGWGDDFVAFNSFFTLLNLLLPRPWSWRALCEGLLLLLLLMMLLLLLLLSQQWKVWIGEGVQQWVLIMKTFIDHKQF